MPTPDLPPLLPEPLLRRLVAAQVEFVVIGGVAVILQGYVRATKDLDIVYATDHENLDRLGEVLTALHARLSGLDEDVPFVADGRSLRRTTILTLDTDEGRIDLLFRPSGSGSYEDLRERARVMDVHGMAVPIASIADLLAMKRAAGRGQDLVDVEQLEAIARIQRRG